MTGKSLIRIALTLGLVALLACPALAAEKYVNGIDANYPPFAYVDKDGKPAGFDVDSMNWIAKKMGFEVTHTPVDWDGIIPSLLAKKIDMICSGMSISAERKEKVAFSNPYYKIGKWLLVRNNAPLTKEQILTGKKKLGVQRGTNEAQWLEENAPKNNWNFELRQYDSPPLAVEDLVNGRIDAAAIDSPPATDAMKKAKKPVHSVGEFTDPDDYGVAVRKEDTALLKKINDGYQLLKKDPYWEELKAKYQVVE